MSSANRDEHEGQENFIATFGLDKLGLLALRAPIIMTVLILALAIGAGYGMTLLRVDDSLSELFRTNTKEFRQYEEIDKRFPSSEYDVLVVVEGKSVLDRKGLEAFRTAMIDLQLAEGVKGLVSMLSARGMPDSTGYAAPVVPDDLPQDEAGYASLIQKLRENDVVKGKFLSDDGQLALAVIALDREVVEAQSAGKIIPAIKDTVDQALAGSGLTSQLTGAPVMQLEIRNAVGHDRIVYNGLGLAFGAAIALIFFRKPSFMIVAAVPPVLAVVTSLGLLGWLGFKLNLFLNVMTPLVLVMGFADSMQVTSAIRDRLRLGDTKRQAIEYATRIVGPACVLAHGTALLAFLALMFSDSGLIRTFGAAGAISTVASYVAVLGALPLLALFCIRDEASLTDAAAPSDAAMEGLSKFVGWIVDHVVKHSISFSVLGLVAFAALSVGYAALEPRYRLADQVPDREQALKATGRLDEKLTGASPVHVMIKWRGGDIAQGGDGIGLFDEQTLALIGEAHTVLETEAGLGNVWSLESLRRWLQTAGDGSAQNIKRYLAILPEHLIRRFIDKDNTAVLVTARLPDVDSSEILPVVDKIDRALEPVRARYPAFEVAVTGLPAIAARNSSSMISQLNDSLPIAVAFVSVLIGLAFRSVFVAFLSLLPGLFPIVTAGTILWLTGRGIEFSSVVALIVIFGLGIDGLVHFLNRLRREERVGEDPALAIRRARVLVGPAIILTTIILAFGLGITVFSALPSLRLFAWVCAVTLSASLIGDLVFLPAMMAASRKLFPVRRSGTA